MYQEAPPYSKKKAQYQFIKTNLQISESSRQTHTKMFTRTIKRISQRIKKEVNQNPTLFDKKNLQLYSDHSNIPTIISLKINSKNIRQISRNVLHRLFRHVILIHVLEKLTYSPVATAKRSHPFPCRTRPLSSSASMVVGGFPLRE